MRLNELADVLGLTLLTPVGAGEDSPTGLAPTAATAATASATANPDISQGFASDLLSDVLANAPAGGVLVTLQVHLNVIAVAGHAGLAAVIFSSGRKPDDDIIARAADEGLALFSSPADTFDLVGRLYDLGIRGTGV
jgi:hypothetical protein